MDFLYNIKLSTDCFIIKDLGDSFFGASPSSPNAQVISRICLLPFSISVAHTQSISVFFPSMTSLTSSIVIIPSESGARLQSAQRSQTTTPQTGLSGKTSTPALIHRRLAFIYKDVYSKRSHASSEQQHQYLSQSAFRLFALK